MAAPLRVPRTHFGKSLAAFSACVANPGRTARALVGGMARAFQDRIAARSPIPQVALRDLVPRSALQLADFEARNGNVSLYELCVIAALVRHRQPKVMLEIGTFDGNTALQMAINGPDDGKVFTLDLPPDPAAATGQLEANDLAYITDAQKQDRRYLHHPAGQRVVQCLGDSATFDFGEVTRHGPPEFVFVDGSHSYDYVRNDTEKVLEIIAPGAAILWHDYVPVWPGVIEYLSDLGQRRPLQRIAGTSLVYLDTGDEAPDRTGSRK